MSNTETNHAGMWDCVEAEGLRRRTRRATGWDNVTHVEVCECIDCGRLVAYEEYSDGMGDHVDFGHGNSVDDVLGEYEL